MNENLFALLLEIWLLLLSGPPLGGPTQLSDHKLILIVVLMHFNLLYFLLNNETQIMSKQGSHTASK